MGMTACGDDEVSSDEQARRAYLGLDESISKALQLGFSGFNAASSANIPLQSAPGNVSGTLLISGQVDQGSSANKNMRLRVGMASYSDGAVAAGKDEDPVNITYASATEPATQPELILQLRDIPNGTFSGTFVGAFQMTGDLKGEVTLSLNMTGRIENDGTGKVRRQAGTTLVTGTATSGEGVYAVSHAVAAPRALTGSARRPWVRAPGAE